jgi:hypothetical protein
MRELEVYALSAEGFSQGLECLSRRLLNVGTETGYHRFRLGFRSPFGSVLQPVLVLLAETVTKNGIEEVRKKKGQKLALLLVVELDIPDACLWTQGGIRRR